MAVIDIFQEFNPQTIEAQWKAEYGNDVPYLYPTFLPARRTDTLDISWLRGQDDLPVTLEPSALDTKPIIRQRRVPARERLTIPFFRESMQRNETDIVELHSFFANPTTNVTGAMAYLDRLLNDGARLVESSRVNREKMFAEMIQTAQFEIQGKQRTSNEDNNVIINYDPTGDWAANNVITSAVDWSDADADIIGEIMNLKRAIRLDGKTVPRYAIIGAETALDIAGNNFIKGLINNQVQIDLNYVTYDEDLYIRTLGNFTGIQFIVYEKTYGDKNTVGADGRPGAQFYFQQRGRISFLPAEIGNMWLGYTPEEIYYNDGSAQFSSEVLYGKDASEDLQLVDGGIALCTKRVRLPIQATIWVAGFFAPSFQAIDDVYVINYTPA